MKLMTSSYVGIPEVAPFWVTQNAPVALPTLAHSVIGSSLESAAKNPEQKLSPAPVVSTENFWKFFS